MGFGGAAAAMNAAIKRNRKLLKDGKRKPFERGKLGGYNNLDKIELNYSDGSPHVLRNIKERMQEENRRHRQRIYFVFAFVILSLIVLFISYF